MVNIKQQHNTVFCSNDLCSEKRSLVKAEWLYKGCHILCKLIVFKIGDLYISLKTGYRRLDIFCFFKIYSRPQYRCCIYQLFK